MSRRLSDPEWIGFQNAVDVNQLNLPVWGGVVQWGSQLILVYVCPGSGTICQQGEIMLTDISDRSDLIRTIPGTYDATQDVWVYHLPAETMARIVELSRTTLETTGQILKTVSETAGQAAGALTRPLLENLALPLIVIVLVYLFGMPSRR
jgi:hypothetical protein